MTGDGGLIVGVWFVETLSRGPRVIRPPPYDTVGRDKRFVFVVPGGRHGGVGLCVPVLFIGVMFFVGSFCLFASARHRAS